MAKPIQLYSLATPNGQKVGVALEEMDLAYEAHTVDILNGEQFKEEFIKLNPNSKIPTILDPEGPGGEPLAVMESGAILVYLAEKSGKFLSSDARKRSETLQWLFFQMGGVGPMFGQFGHFFKYAKDKCDHPYPVERYTNESKRLLGVLDKHLSDKDYLAAGEYTIADMATFPWVGCLDWGYNAAEALSLKDFKNVEAWYQRCKSRPKSAVGLNVCPINWQN